MQCLFGKKRENMYEIMFAVVTVADPEFPNWVVSIYYFSQLSVKLHEKEKTGPGGREWFSSPPGPHPQINCDNAKAGI